VLPGCSRLLLVFLHKLWRLEQRGGSTTCRRTKTHHSSYFRHLYPAGQPPGQHCCHPQAPGEGREQLGNTQEANPTDIDGLRSSIDTIAAKYNSPGPAPAGPSYAAAAGRAPQGRGNNLLDAQSNQYWISRQSARVYPIFGKSEKQKLRQDAHPPDWPGREGHRPGPLSTETEVKTGGQGQIHWRGNLTPNCLLRPQLGGIYRGRQSNSDL